MDFMLGSDYENIRPLDAKGGMGDLFRAHKKGLDVEVVIKRIKRKYIGRLDQQNEANILKGLKHQYLPRIYDVIPGEDGCLYTIMDYIPGVDLQQYVKQNGRVPQPLAHRWACQLCEVVAYLHAQTPPILHCDIKPHNIMITGQGDICLIDFNTSLVFQGDDTVVGVTKGYAAPEQYLAAPTGAVGRPAAPTVSPTAATVMAAPTEYAAPAPLSSAPSAAPSNPLVRRSSQPSFSAAVTASAGAYGPLSVRTDVYAIGATMYYMVTAATPERSLDPVTDVTAHRPAISRTMVSIIRRAMSKQQKNRFASADEMLRALQDVDKLDRRYRHFVAARRATVGVLCAAWLASAGLTLYGANLLRGERINNYLEQVAEGRAQDEDGQYAAADATLRAAVDTMPRRVEGYTALATVFYHRGDYQSAVDLAEGALTSEMLDPAKDTAADGEVLKSKEKLCHLLPRSVLSPLIWTAPCSIPRARSPPVPGRPLPMPPGAGSSCCPAPGGPLPACRRWWRSCPASGTPSPPTVPLSGIWAQTRWVPYTAAMPMRPSVRPMNRFCWSVIVCPRKPPGKPLRSIRSTTAH